MRKKSFQFSSRKVDCYFDASFAQLEKLVDRNQAVVVTDQNIFSIHRKKFSGWKTIVLRPGEKYKNQDSVNELINELIRLEADRKSVLIGVGGGVVTDITGYAASIYMRGISFG